MTEIPPSPPLTTRILQRRSRVIIACVIVAIAVLAISTSKTSSRNPESMVNPRAEAPNTFRPTKAQWTNLNLAPVQTMLFQTEVTAEGYIANDDEATTSVFSPYSGHVTRLIAKLGETVKQGSPLMAVEASEVVQGYNEFIGAAAARDTAVAEYKLAEAAEQRQHDAYVGQSGALKDWLQSQADLAVARNNLRTAETTFTAARNRLRILGKSDAEIDDLKQVSNGKFPNPEALIKSPISGTVIQRQVGLGQYINSVVTGAPNPVYVIANSATVWLVANVREADAPLVGVGDLVETHVIAYPGRTFAAKIVWVAPALDPNTHRLSVRAEIANPDGALKPNMFANFSIVTDKGVVAPAIPRSAIVYEGNQARAWVAGDDGTVGLRLIQTGRMHNGMLEVTGGLTAGEKIVTSGTLFIDRAAESSNQ